MKKVVFVLFALLMLAMPVLAEDMAKVVAVVEGQEVTLSELDNVMNMQEFMMQLYQANAEFTQLLLMSENGQNLLNEYRKTQLEQYVVQVLLGQEAEKRNLSISEERENEIFEQRVQQILQQNNVTREQLLQAIQQQGIASFEEYKNIFIEQSGKYLLIDELQKQVLSEIVATDAEVQEYYENNQSQFESDEAVHASHILVKTKEEAEDLLVQLQNGKDFAELAKEASVGPSGPSGGDLGFLTRGQTVAEFDEAVFALEVGGLSGVVETQFGFHIIKVHEKREAGVVGFDEVKDVIKDQLTNKKKSEAWDEFMKNLRENAVIEIKL